MPNREKDDERGYGGGRERLEQTPEHAFGEQGFSGSRLEQGQPAGSHDTSGRNLPEGVHDSGPADNKWQERFTRENADKFGQGGGKPIAQRGPSQSMGGQEHKEAGLGSTKDISPRGGYGIRETEQWPEPDDAKEKNKERRGS